MLHVIVAMIAEVTIGVLTASSAGLILNRPREFFTENTKVLWHLYMQSNEPQLQLSNWNECFLFSTYLLIVIICM